MAALLLDENMPRTVATLLAAMGHDLVMVTDIEPGADDVRVLVLARQSVRLLVTFDSDFGELVFQQGALPPPAIVYVRLHPIDPEVASTLVAEALRGETRELFIVCTRDGTRRRPMPVAGPA